MSVRFCNCGRSCPFRARDDNFNSLDLPLQKLFIIESPVISIDLSVKKQKKKKRFHQDDVFRSDCTLTTFFTTWRVGLAEAQRRNRRFMLIPITIPSSSRMNRQHRNVAPAGTKSISVNRQNLLVSLSQIAEHTIIFALH